MTLSAFVWLWPVQARWAIVGLLTLIKCELKVRYTHTNKPRQRT